MGQDPRRIVLTGTGSTFYLSDPPKPEPVIDPTIVATRVEERMGKAVTITRHEFPDGRIVERETWPNGTVVERCHREAT